MHITKKIFILLNIFFLVSVSKVFAIEKIEAKYSKNIIEDEYIPAVFYNTPNINLSEFQKEKYINEHNIKVGISADQVSRFDLRDKIDIKIRNQGKSFLCWIYSTNTVLETNLKMNNINLSSDFDVISTDKETAKVYSKLTSNGNTSNNEGGTQLILLNYYTSGAGPKLIDSENVEIEVEDFVIFPSIYKEIKNGKIEYYTKDLISNKRENYSKEEVNQIRNRIKEHIITYGAVTSNIYSLGEEYYDNQSDLQKSEAFYCDDSSKIEDHAITIIGWDDNYSKENFNSNHRPVNDGAYIVLNSWGEKFSGDGVYYISYDDCLIEKMIWGIESSRKN